MSPSRSAPRPSCSKRTNKNLDVQRLDLPGQLEDLVLDLAILERGGFGARRRVDLRVELIGLCRLSSLAHRLNGLEGRGIDGSEIDPIEGIDKDCIGLRLRVTSGAVRDLEGGVAAGVRLSAVLELNDVQSVHVLLFLERAPGEAERCSSREAGKGDDNELGGEVDHLGKSTTRSVQH